MFIDFFYTLKSKGVPVTPTAFLRLHQALSLGIIRSLNDFYTVARTILIKSERYFDVYDLVFLRLYRCDEFRTPEAHEITEVARMLVNEWLGHPHEIARALEVTVDDLRKLTPEELVQCVFNRITVQEEAHHGGNQWFGSGEAFPIGHAGYQSGGIRVGGVSGHKSAINVARERRYKDYSQDGSLTQSQMGEALKKLRRLVPTGPSDVVNVNMTIYETMRKGGEIEIVHDRRLQDRIKVILMIDNGGWSMDAHIPLVQTLFSYVHAQFKELTIYYFHNTIYDEVWEDPSRRIKPKRTIDFSNEDRETRLIIVGDASMDPHELTGTKGFIHLEKKRSRPSIEHLKFLAETFPHAVWINPETEKRWEAWSVNAIKDVFHMYDLSLAGLDKAVNYLMSRH